MVYALSEEVEGLRRTRPVVDLVWWCMQLFEQRRDVFSDRFALNSISMLPKLQKRCIAETRVCV